MLSVDCRYIKGSSRTIRLCGIDSLPRQMPNNLQIYLHERKHFFRMPHLCSHSDVNPSLLAVPKTIHAEQITLPSSIHTDYDSPHFSTFTHNSLQHVPTSHRENRQKAVNKSPATVSSPAHTTWRLSTLSPS